MIKIRKPSDELKEIYKENIMRRYKRINISYNVLNLPVTDGFLSIDFIESLLCDEIFHDEYVYKQYIDKYIALTRFCNNKNLSINDIESFKKIYNKSIEQIKFELSEFNNEISAFFTYVGFNSSIRVKIINDINVKVCPYCNRAFTTNFVYEDDLKTTADLDHFYPKKYYPLFSLSLFNFIPSCLVCNSRFKSSHDREILYPYYDSFGSDAFFSLGNDEADSILYSLLGKTHKLELTINVDPRSEKLNKINNSIELFKLKELYDTHIDHASNIKRRKYCFRNGYEAVINDLLKKTNKQISFEEIETILYGYQFNKEEDYTILEKLSKDMISESKNHK